MPEIVTREDMPQRSSPPTPKSRRQITIDAVIADNEEIIRDLISGDVDGDVILFNEFHAHVNECHRITGSTVASVQDQCRSAVRKALDELDPDLRDQLSLTFGWDGYLEVLPRGRAAVTGFDLFVSREEEVDDDE